MSDFEIFDAVRGASDSSMQPRYAPVRPGEAMHVVLDSSKAQQILSWKPKVALSDGILQVVDHYRRTIKPASGDVWNSMPHHIPICYNSQSGSAVK